MSAAWDRVHVWFTWGLLVVVWGLLVWLWLLPPTPVVSRTWPDGACVAVDPPFSCAALPARYVTQWVAPEEEER